MPRSGRPGAKLSRGDGALVGKCRRHSNIDEGYLRLVSGDGVNEGISVADHGAGVDAGFGEQPR
jgi:hypothetical protein